jgi:hypothetical protein
MKYALVLLALFATQVVAQTVTLTADPVSGTDSVTTTLTWTSTGLTSCVASGGWTGVKALNGFEKVTVTKTTDFILTCSKTTETAKLSWTPPTQREDNTALALTEIQEHLVYRANTSTGVSTAVPVIVPMPTTTYTFQELPQGTWHFGVKTKAKDGTVSKLSLIVNKTITSVTQNATTNVKVLVAPKPPTITTIETVVYEVRDHHIHGYRVWRQVGSIDVGVECNADFGLDGGYYEVPLDKVRLFRMPQFMVVVARCS